MEEGGKTKLRLEIAHVLFIDIVAYSKMAMDDQRAAVEKLNQIAQSTDEFRAETRAAAKRCTESASWRRKIRSSAGGLGRVRR